MYFSWKYEKTCHVHGDTAASDNNDEDDLELKKSYRNEKQILHYVFKKELCLLH